MEEVKKQGMESLFCPYELALELKELGFDEPCFAFYGLSRDDYKTIRLSIFQNLKTDYLSDVHHLDVTCDAPLYQQAFRFFREKYKLLSFVDIDSSYRIYCDDIKFDLDIDSIIFKTYEEAELECLVKLIEITKEQNVK